MVGAFMQDVVDEWQAGPVAVFPVEAGIDDTGGPAGAPGLALRGRVGPLDQAVEAEDIEGVRFDAIEAFRSDNPCAPLCSRTRRSGERGFSIQPCDIRCPDEKGAAAPSPVDGTQWQPSVHVRPPGSCFARQRNAWHRCTHAKSGGYKSGRSEWIQDSFLFLSALPRFRFSDLRRPDIQR